MPPIVMETMFFSPDLTKVELWRMLTKYKRRNFIMNFTTWFAIAIAIIVPVAIYISQNNK